MTRLLIVDDNEDNLYLLRTVLEAGGHHVASARHGAEALVRARQQPPDLVVSDILMPVMDGFELCRQWKADDDLKQIPFVFYTATYTEPRDEALALSLGADGFILKPAEPETFLARLMAILANARSGILRPSNQPTLDERATLIEYNQILVRKLEEKMLDLERAKHELEHDITRRQTEETERRRLQAELLQAQKMESVGRLAGGVAHDFNNLLTVIQGSAQILEEDPALADPDLRGLLRDILRATRQATDLTRQLLAFGRKQVLDFREVDLGDVIVGFRSMVARLIGEDIEVVTKIDENLPLISADPSQIQQILLNLAVNARDAMPSGGLLTIEARHAPSEVRDERVLRGVQPEIGARLCVSDTGCGMTPETIAQVFEPFFTTKPLGKGTGLGLSTVYGIVQQHGGRIDVTSEPGTGTTFTIDFPAVAAADSPDAAGDHVDPPGRGSESILLVEDQAELRSLVARVLSGRGYRVLAASDVDDAVALAQPGLHHIDLLLVDMVMPGRNGRALYDEISTGLPGLKVLFMSGYSGDVLSKHRVVEEGLPFLQKPFSPDDLARLVRHVLDGSAGPGRPAPPGLPPKAGTSS
jgi:signal transduction histidine kinase